MAAFLAEAGFAGCSLRSGWVPGDLMVVLPEPDGRLLAPRPGVVRIFYCRGLTLPALRREGRTPGSPGRQLLLWPNRTTRLRYWDDDSPRLSHGRYAILVLTVWP